MIDPGIRDVETCIGRGAEDEALLSEDERFIRVCLTVCPKLEPKQEAHFSLPEPLPSSRFRLTLFTEMRPTTCSISLRLLYKFSLRGPTIS